MNHRTQLNLDEADYHFLKDSARADGLSIAAVIRKWIKEKRNKRLTKKYLDDSFFKMRGIGSSGKSDIAQNFDDYLYGGKE